MSYKAIVVKAPQGTTLSEWLRIAEYAHRYQHDMTASHDSALALLRAGTKDSYVKLAYPARQMDFARMVEDAGYRWEPILNDNPFAGLTFGQPLDTPWAITSPFNEPRNYSHIGGPANARHEGVDASPTVPGVARVLAVADGIVTKIGMNDPGYGNYVIVTSVHNGASYTTWRAHMASISPFLAVNVEVRKGDVLGICGASGNASGRHDHLTMTSPLGGMSGYTVANVIDPTPFYPAPTQTYGFDVLPYLKGNGVIYEMEVMWKGTLHRQQMETQTGWGTRYYQVKNHQWEEMWFDPNHIWRGADTSPGDGMYYVQRTNALDYGAIWCPRYWNVGDLYERYALVTWYDSATGSRLAEPESGYHRTWLEFTSHLDRYRMNSGIVVEDVVELTWYPRKDGPWAEKYYYARDMGLVAWASSAGDYSYVSRLYASEEERPASMAREVVAGL